MAPTQTRDPRIMAFQVRDLLAGLEVVEADDAGVAGSGEELASRAE